MLCFAGFLSHSRSDASLSSWGIRCFRSDPANTPISINASGTAITVSSFGWAAATNVGSWCWCDSGVWLFRKYQQAARPLTVSARRSSGWNRLPLVKSITQANGFQIDVTLECILKRCVHSAAYNRPLSREEAARPGLWQCCLKSSSSSTSVPLNKNFA